MQSIRKCNESCHERDEEMQSIIISWDKFLKIYLDYFYDTIV